MWIEFLGLQTFIFLHIITLLMSLSNKKPTIKKSFVVFVFMLLSVIGFTPYKSHAAISEWQKGFTLSLVDQSNSQIDASLEQLAATGANFVAISPGWLTDNKYSSNVVRKSRTPSDEKVRYTIRKAKSLGLKVMIKPHLDRKDGGWRAFIDPSDKAKFFQNYSNMMLLYADIAAQEGADQISVGAELFKLSTNKGNEKYWREMIGKIRQKFNGTLTYSANSDSEYFDEGGLPFWDALDYWGSSMYISVAKDNYPTKEKILQEWKWAEDRYYKPMYAKIGKPLIAAEIGYRSVDGAGKSPEEFENNPKIDLEEQRLLYEMFFEFWKDKPYFAGTHFWFWEAGDNVGGSKNNDYTVQFKPAEAVVTSYFKSGGDTYTPPTSGSSTGSGSTPTSTPTFEFFKNIKVNGSEAPAASTKTGADFYTDRNYTFKELPSFLVDGEFIKVKNGDKTKSSSDYLKFELKKSSDLYVAYDARADKLPEWLRSWEDTEYTLKTSDNVFDIYRKASQSGSLTLGGNMASGASGAESNYILFASTKTYTSNSQSPDSSSGSDASGTDSSSNNSSNNNTEDNSSDNNSGSESNTNAVINGKIEVKGVKDGDDVSGTEKLKYKIEDVKADTYDGFYELEGDGLGEVKMENSSEDKFKKVDFDDFEPGEYRLTYFAREKDGTLIDSAEITIIVKD